MMPAQMALMHRPSRKQWALLGSVILGLASALAAAGVWGKSSPEQLAAKARRAVQQKDWPLARSLLNKLSHRRVPTTDDVLLLAELELGLGHPDDAIHFLTAINESNSVAARARLVAGQIQKKRNRVRPAEALLLEALWLDPRLALAHRELIVIYAMQARRADLNDQFRALAELEPLKFDDVLLWTASLEDIWINDSIRGELERYIAADPQDRQSRLALGSVLLRSGDVDQAESILQPLAEGDAEAQLLRAGIAMNRNDLVRVRALLTDGPTDHPGFAVGRAQLAARSNDPAGAARQFQIALKHDPANREAVQGLSLALTQLDRGDEADIYRRKGDLWRRLTGLLERARVSGIHPHGQALYKQLAQTCEALQRAQEAAAWYRLALALDATDSEAQHALFRLHPPPT
jgi:tetratricopeptide (TPR) repeat protein